MDRRQKLRHAAFDVIVPLSYCAPLPRLHRTGGHVLDWMYFNYVTAIAMTLRRELDHQKTANLRHLLHEMEERPQVITRGRYRALWPESERRDRFGGPDRDFERHQIVRVRHDPERDYIAPEEFRSDREQLITQTEVVREFVERTFAHRSPEKPAAVTLKQVHDAVEAIVEMFKKYYTLFRAASLKYSSADRAVRHVRMLHVSVVASRMECVGRSCSRPAPRHHLRRGP